MIRAIGSFVVALFVMAIPILATLSWECNWNGFAKYFFTIGTLAEVIGLACAIYTNAE